MKNNTKQILSVLAIIVLVILVQNSMGGIKSGDSVNPLSATVELKNDTDEAIYGFIVEYAIDRTPLGGQLISADPDMSLKVSTGESIPVSFNSKAFNDTYNIDSGTFGMFVSVITEDKDEIPVKFIYEWKMQYGYKYNFTLTGNPQDGFELVPDDSVENCVVTAYSELK